MAGRDPIESPPRAAVEELLRDLISGRRTRASIADWASNWIRGPLLRDYDEPVWTALTFMVAADMPSTDREFLYGQDDFEAWLNALLAGDPHGGGEGGSSAGNDPEPRISGEASQGG